MKLNLIIAAICLILGFYIGNRLGYQNSNKVKETTVYIPEIIKTTDTITVEKVITKIIAGKQRVKVDSTYYHKYIEANDSIEKLNLYVDAITISDTVLTLVDNDTIGIKVWSKVRGKLLAQSGEYKIKAREFIVETPVIKPPRVIIGGGVFAGSTTNGVELLPGGMVNVSTKNGKTYWGGYSIDGTIIGGITWPIFKIK